MQFIALFGRVRRERRPRRSVRKFDLDGQIFCLFLHQNANNVALRARNAEDSVPYKFLLSER